LADIVTDYFGHLRSVIGDIEEKEGETIRRVGHLAAESLSHRGVLHVFDTGHMLTSELMGRAGGLLAWTPFSFGLSVNNPNRHRDTQAAPAPDDMADLVRLAFGRSRVKAGDMLFVGSVSGKTPNCIEVALQGRQMGATVVAVTSVAYSSTLQSQHSSGKRLFETAEYVIDNHAPAADAMLEVPGFPRAICPASGIAAACIMWSVNAAITAELVAMGKEPSVYQSVNMPGGPENVRAIEARYTELGI